MNHDSYFYIGLKVVLLHNKNQFPSVLLAYSTNLKDTYTTIEKILSAINYAKHQWQIIGDLKVSTILFGMQSGYTKYPCYLCEWDSRAKNKYEKTVWPSRTEFQIGKKNVLNTPLVRPETVLLPPLHLKMGFMKQLVKALPVESEAFQYLKGLFPKLSDAKVKEGTFHKKSFFIITTGYTCTKRQ